MPFDVLSLSDVKTTISGSCNYKFAVEYTISIQILNSKIPNTINARLSTQPDNNNNVSPTNTTYCCFVTTYARYHEKSEESKKIGESVITQLYFPQLF